MTDYNELLKSVLEPAIDFWFRRQAADLYAHYYLYYRKARTGERISIPVISDKRLSDTWVSAMAERISPTWTKKQAFEKCLEALKDKPMLGQ